MIPFARFRILDPLLDGLFRGDPGAIAILVLLVLLIVGLGIYNSRRGKRDDDDSSRAPWWMVLVQIAPYFVAIGLLIGAFKLQNASLGASAFIVLSGADLIRGDGDMWWSRWQTWDETTARIISGVIVAIAGLVLIVALMS